MDIKAMQSRLKAIANDMATLENKEGGWTETDQTAYKTLVAEGVKLRDTYDARAEAEEFKKWAKGSDGQSEFKAGLNARQEITSPEDRQQEMKAQEAASKKAYAPAFESYLRHGFNGMGDNDKKALMAGNIKAIGDGAANTGDFSVPEDFQAEVIKKTPGLIGLTDIVRVQPTSRDVVVWPRINYTTDNKYTAPLRLTFGPKIPSTSTGARVTDETFGEARIPINTAMASQLVGNALIEDSATDIIALTTQLFNENIMQDIEYYQAQGTGSGQPEGLFNNVAAQTNYSIGGAAASVTSAGIQAAYWAVPAQYRANGKWVMSSATGLIVSQMVDGNGRYMWSADNMFGGNLSSAQSDGVLVTNPKLLGLPVVITEQAPTATTNAFPISVGNHLGYIRAERVGMTIRVMNDLYAETDQTLFLLRVRFGGQLVEDYKIKLIKCATS